MSEPTTPTGKRLRPAASGNYYRRNPDGTMTDLASHSVDDILAIEREAAAAERARLRAGVLDLPTDDDAGLSVELYAVLGLLDDAAAALEQGEPMG